MTWVDSKLSLGLVTELGPYGSPSFDPDVAIVLVELPTAANGKVVGPVEEPERLGRLADEGRRCLIPPVTARAGAGTAVCELADACIRLLLLLLLRDLDCECGEGTRDETGGVSEDALT